jgi:hypothetical protein
MARRCPAHVENSAGVDRHGVGTVIRFGHLLRHAHIAEKEKRTAPGVQGDDFRPYLRALQEINYTGALAIEGGSTFSEALSMHSRIFDPLVINMQAREVGYYHVPSYMAGERGDRQFAP